MKPRVLVACCNQGWLRKEVAQSLLALQGDGRVDLQVLQVQETPFVQGLHVASHAAIQGGYDFVLFVDDDNPPIRNPLDLVFLDLDVVGCPTPVRKPGGWLYNVVAEVDGELKAWEHVHGDGRGLVEVDAVGTGCLLVRVSVLADLFQRCKGNPSEAPFMRRWNDRGLVERGNDFAFCERVRRAGYKVYAHWGYLCEHVVEVGLTDLVNTVVRVVEKQRG